MNKILKHWDRLGIYLLLMAFGAYSTVYPIVSLQRSAPYWASIALGVEFLIAGFFLILGLFGKSGYRMAGLLVVVVGLFTISLVVATYGGSSRLAYAFLFGAFAMQAVSDIREEKAKWNEVKQQESKLAKELVELIQENRLGESR